MPGPANLYGVANPVSLPGGQIVFGPIACPAGVETTVASPPALTAPSGGYFYPMCWFNVEMLSGATLAVSVTFAIRIGAGSDVDTAYFVPASYQANNYAFFSMSFSGPPSNTIWQGAGSVVNITCNPNSQPVTCYNMKYTVGLFRAPDQ